MNTTVAKELLKSWEATKPKQNQAMNKIEEIEELLKDWNASLDKSYNGSIPSPGYCNGGVKALEAALEIIKRSSDTTIQTDTEPCENCVEYQKMKGTERWLIHCPTCGRLLDR